MTTDVERGSPSRSAMRTWMDIALEHARRGMDAGEAPIGCVLVDADGAVIGSGCNTLRESGNPTLHAEMNAFAAAAGRIADASHLTLVSTLEPCVMCLGAAMQAGVHVIVYGLQAPADAGTRRVTPPASPGATNPTIVGGIASDECRTLFLHWMKRHSGDASRDEQRAFIRQLLELTPGPT
jgi:tRNA(Arg) A34 adenosine deaminase TadA